VKPTASSPQHEHTPEHAHRDIAFGNEYRLEYIKHLVSIATGVFVFSVTFMKDVVGSPTPAANMRGLLLVGWVALLISIFAGLFHMRLWAAYYISWGVGWKESSARAWRRKLNRWRKVSEVSQFVGFGVGTLLLVAFAAVNLFG
jgi:hypothetical protein